MKPYSRQYILNMRADLKWLYEQFETAQPEDRSAIQSRIQVLREKLGPYADEPPRRARKKFVAELEDQLADEQAGINDKIEAFLNQTQKGEGNPTGS